MSDEYAKKAESLEKGKEKKARLVYGNPFIDGKETEVWLESVSNPLDRRRINAPRKRAGGENGKWTFESFSDWLSRWQRQVSIHGSDWVIRYLPA